MAAFSGGDLLSYSAQQLDCHNLAAREARRHQELALSVISDYRALVAPSLGFLPVLVARTVAFRYQRTQRKPRMRPLVIDWLIAIVVRFAV